MVERTATLLQARRAVYTSPVVANGTFYVTSLTQLLAVKCDGSDGRRQEQEGSATAKP